MAVVTMKNLLESGVHFGHQVNRKNPKMNKYIFAERNGINIIDLQKTIVAIRAAYDAVRQVVSDGKSVLFVGTKKQAQETIQKEAERCGMFYVNNRWLGGMLTNFSTIKKSIAKLMRIEKMEVDGSFGNLTKKEVAELLHEKQKLEKNIGGMKEMKDIPGIIFIIDTCKEDIAIHEAARLGIPIVAVVDTNGDPSQITYPIPGNDDAIRSISLFTQVIANAVLESQGLKLSKICRKMEKLLQKKVLTRIRTAKRKLLITVTTFRPTMTRLVAMMILSIRSLTKINYTKIKDNI